VRPLFCHFSASYKRSLAELHLWYGGDMILLNTALAVWTLYLGMVILFELIDWLSRRLLTLKQRVLLALSSRQSSQH
jgi:hypothetical protein